MPLATRIAAPGPALGDAAFTMSFSDTFVLICSGFALAALLVPPLPRPAPMMAAPADAH